MAMKKWEELDVLDNYLINVLASDPEVAEPFFKRLVSVLLQRDVGRIMVEAEKILPGNSPDRRGIRLDVEVKEYLSEKNSVTNVYDLEPHIQNDTDFPKMMRFRQARLDSSFMKRGDNDFSNLPDLYVILITNFDIFDKDYMMYTFNQTCKEIPNIKYNDGLTFLYFNTKGTLSGSRDIENMLKYLQDSRKDQAVDPATKELDSYIESVRNNQDLKGVYMTLGDLIDSECENECRRVTLATRFDDIIDILQVKGNVSDELKNRLKKEDDSERLRYLVKLAARSDSIETFEKNYDSAE